MALTFLKEPPPVSLTGNPILVSCSSPLEKDFLRIHVDIYVADPPILRKVGHLVKSGNTAEFDVSSILDQKGNPQFTFPESSDNLLIKHEMFSIRYYLKFYTTHYENGETVNSDIYAKGFFHALQGGIPEDLEAMYNQLNTDFYSELQKNKQFLSWSPQTTYISPEQTVKLFWMQREGDTSVKLKIRKHTEQGESEETLQTLSLESYEVVELCVSPALLDLEDATSYTVFLANSSNEIISEERNFILDKSYYKRNDCFLFQNSLGAFDTIWAKGQRKDEVEVDRSSYTKSTNHNYDITSRSSFNTRGIVLQKNTSEIGYITNPEVLECFQEILLSENVYWLDESRSWPINILSSKTTLVEDKTDYWSVKLNWKKSLQSRYYAHKNLKLPALPPLYEAASCFFSQYRGHAVIDAKSDYRAEVIDGKITFPEVPGDIFNKTNTTYWQDIPNTYGDRTWSLEELRGTHTILYSTEACRKRLFFKDPDDGAKNCYPIIVYDRDLSEEECDRVVEYLDGNQFLMDADGAILKDNNEKFLKI